MACLVAVLFGIGLYTDLPKRLGLWQYLASRDPMLVGFTPAFLDEQWNYRFEELYKHDLQGQYAIVTGASSGIGFAISKTLAGRLGAHVTLACRNPTKCLAKKQEILESHPKAQLDTMTMDTSSLESVSNFADEYLSTNKPLDMLFLNAGTGYNPDGPNYCVPLTEKDGLELLFQINYLGHHLLYRKLEPLLLYGTDERIPARVVQTSSAASYASFTFRVATNLEQLNGCIEPAITAKGNLSYGQSKLAQILWVQHLTKRLEAIAISNGCEDEAVTADSTKSDGELELCNTASTHKLRHRRDAFVNAFHPGLVATEIFDKIGGGGTPQFVIDTMKSLANKTGWTSLEGALTGLYLGVAVEDLQAHSIRGQYFHPQALQIENHPLAPNNYMNDGDDLPEMLWEFSDSLVKDYL